MIKRIKRKDLDLVKYDACIANAKQSRIYAFSWYLDVVAENWDVLVLDDYQAVMPLPWKRKYGFKYTAQPYFCQQLGFFSLDTMAKSTQQEFIKALPKTFLKVSLQLHATSFFEPTFLKKKNYVLALNDHYNSIFKGFNKGRKHAIKSAKKHNLTIQNIEIAPLIALQQSHYHYHLSVKEEDTLKQLVEKTTRNGYGFLVGVFAGDDFLGGGFFLKSNHRIIYIFSAFNEEGKTKQAASFLINDIIDKNQNTNLLLDFEGGEIATIASFFKSFGAKKETYFLFTRSFL